MTLPRAFLDRPLAHRGLHGAGVPENSRAAFEATIAHGYGIELDIQSAADGTAMVFHDDVLDRMTEQTGPINARDVTELRAIPLRGADEGIPTLAEVLALVDGRAPLLIEIKDQDGALGANVGPLEQGVADAFKGYAGPAAVMSFNPHSVAQMQALSPNVPRGLTTCAFSEADWPSVPAERRRALRTMPDLERLGASFISHEAADLSSPHVGAARAGGLRVLCWTIRTPSQAAMARKYADNITFEGYAAPLA